MLYRCTDDSYSCIKHHLGLYKQHNLKNTVYFIKVLYISIYIYTYIYSDICISCIK